jgi:hypothetical protein
MARPKAKTTIELNGNDLTLDQLQQVAQDAKARPA